MYIYLFFLFVWFLRKSALERFITRRCIMYRGQFFTRLRFFLEESQLGIVFIFTWFIYYFLFCFVGSAIFEKWSVIINLFQMSRCFFFFFFICILKYLFRVKITFGMWERLFLLKVRKFLFHIFKEWNIFKECNYTRQNCMFQYFNKMLKPRV